MSMKVKFGALKSLDGKDITNNEGVVYIDKTLANAIVSDHARDPMQKYELAHKLFHANGEEIEITESEKEIIKYTASSGSMTVLVSAQVLNIINNIK